jgi:hypothetical protein
MENDNDVVERQTRGSCGCPFSRSTCEQNCQRKYGANIVGRCSGFLWFSCSCSINNYSVTITNQC